jgi:cell division protein FtsZ
MLNLRIQTPEVQKLSPKITVVGVGGAGGNAVNNMISSGLEGCEFVVCNTDAQALEGSLSEGRLQLGAAVTGGLGAGAKPEVGAMAAEESLAEVMEYLDGSNMVFVTAGMGGGTGTGAAPVIAKACRDAGILTVGVVTKPFHFEGSHRMRQAEAGIQELQSYVDTLIIIPNQNLFRVANEKTTFAEAFRLADSVLQSGVRGVTDLMVMPGLINLDFADIRSAMLEMGKAMMGTGEAEGERRAIEAAEAAISNPLLDDVSMKGARGVIINVTGGSDMTLFEVDEACNRIREEVDPNANIIFGSTFDEKLEGRMRVSVVATGIDAESAHGRTTSTSGVRVTAVGKSQAPVEKPALERAKPNVETVHAATLSARNAAMRIPPRPSAAAPQASLPLNASDIKVDEPETELFEQQEFVPSYATAQAGGMAVRGSLHQGQFIPPAPVIPEPQDVRPSGYGPQFNVPQYASAPQAAQQQAPQPYPGSGSGLVLRPPVPGVHQQASAAGTVERKKTPSLFERITSGVSAHVRRDETADDQGQGGDTSSAGGFHSGLRARSPAPAAAPSQGRLNIDSPAAPRAAEGENDLDIPAFLRRQAN